MGLVAGGVVGFSSAVGLHLSGGGMLLLLQLVLCLTTVVHLPESHEEVVENLLVLLVTLSIVAVTDATNLLAFAMARAVKGLRSLLEVGLSHLIGTLKGCGLVGLFKLLHQ